MAAGKEELKLGIRPGKLGPFRSFSWQMDPARRDTEADISSASSILQVLGNGARIWRLAATVCERRLWLQFPACRPFRQTDCATHQHTYKRPPRINKRPSARRLFMDNRYSSRRTGSEVSHKTIVYNLTSMDILPPATRIQLSAISF
jgi:hypothetical protein